MNFKIKTKKQKSGREAIECVNGCSRVYNEKNALESQTNCLKEDNLE